MIRVAISGACGRMGKRLVEIASAQEDMEVVGALDAPGHPLLGRDAGELAGVGALGVQVTTDLAVEADALIEFSAPEPTTRHAALCAEKGMAAVIGTTGLSDEQIAAVHDAAKRAPILLAPNMSVGVNVAFEVAAMLARTLGEDYDIEIVETHHRHKKDAPSGTAKGFLKAVAQALDRDLQSDVVYGRQGVTGERPRRQIGVHALRGGDEVGEHRVIFFTEGERIELVHRATDRDVFARGAVRLARELVGKPPGLYGVKDILMGQ